MRRIANKYYIKTNKSKYTNTEKELFESTIQKNYIYESAEWQRYSLTMIRRYSLWST